MSLYKANKGVDVTVTSMPNISLLRNLGLRNGARINVQNRYALGGPVLLKVDDAYSIAIGKEIATQIAVMEISKG